MRAHPPIGGNYQSDILAISGSQYEQIAIMPDVHLSPSGVSAIARLSRQPPLRLTMDQVMDSTGTVFSSPDALVAAWQSKLDATFLSRLPSLRVIALRATSKQNVDTGYASRYGIAVTNIKGYGDTGTAEFVVEQLLWMARSDSARTSEWPCELDGKRLGLIGFGAVAQLVARTTQSLGMDVKYHVPYPESKSRPSTAQCLPLRELLATSDFLSFHSPAYQTVVGLDDLKCIDPAAGVIVTTLGLPFQLDEFLEWRRHAKNTVIFDLCAAHGRLESLSSLQHIRVAEIYSARTNESVARAEQMLISNLANYLTQHTSRPLRRIGSEAPAVGDRT